MPDVSRNTVFISYPSEDFQIASSISAAINAMPGNKLDVFLDQENMSIGQRIPETIQGALRKSVFFVAIATNVSRRSFEWCGLELGFYQGTYDDKSRREACLYHLTFPDLFSETKNFKLMSLRADHREQFVDKVVSIESSNVYEFLRGIAKLNAELHPSDNPDTYWRLMPAWLASNTTTITESFFSALQTRVENVWYPQGRIQVSIQRGDFYKDVAPEIPSDSEVTFSGSIYNIFSAGVPDIIRPVSWDKFIEFLKENTGGDVLARLLTDIGISALPSRADAKADYIYQAPNQMFYRILLVKHSVYGNRRRELVFNLIRTLDKVQGGDKKTTALVAGIVIASKYRSLFVETNARYGFQHVAALKLEDAAAEVSQMMQDIERVTADAASDGLADFTALLNLLKATHETRILFDKWWAVFPQMEAAAKALMKEANQENLDTFLQVYRPFVDVSRQNNDVFLRLCLDAYRQSLGLAVSY